MIEKQLDKIGVENGNSIDLEEKAKPAIPSTIPNGGIKVGYLYRATFEYEWKIYIANE